MHCQYTHTRDMKQSMEIKDALIATAPDWLEMALAEEEEGTADESGITPTDPNKSHPLGFV